MTDPTIHAISLPTRTVFLEDGRILPITNLFDAIGEETADPDEAVSFVCGSGRLWISDRLDSFEAATIH